jgi:hypothetical protein
VSIPALDPASFTITPRELVSVQRP